MHSRSPCRRSGASPIPASSATSSSSRPTSAVVRIKDVAKVDLAALDYTTNSYLDRDPAIGIGIFQLPGSNALATAKAVQATMDQLAKNFPAGLKYTVIYNPTQFIQQSVNAVTETIGEAVILVVLVVILFLQTWRAAVIPLVAIPSIAGRHVPGDGDVRLLAEQSLAVRPGAGHRHRGGRRHRRGGERRAQYRRRAVAARCRPEKHGRGRDRR